MPTPGAIEQVGSATQAATASSGTVTVTKPTGVAENDVLIAVLAQNEQTVTLPSGFTLVAESASGDTPNIFSGHMYRKTAGSSEPADYTFSVGTSGAPMAVIMSAWRNVDTANVIEAVSEIAEGSSAEPSNPATGFTPTNAGRLLFMRAARSTTAIPTFSNGTSNWTELGDIGEFSGGTVRYAVCLVAHDFDTDGGSARSEPAITCSTTETDNVYILVQLRSIPPADTETGTGTETESGTVTAPDSDSGTGTETELVTIPIADSDSGVGTETDEDIVALTHHIASDNFNRQDETSLTISSSGMTWTSA